MEERGGISRGSSAVASGAATPREAAGTGGSGTTTPPGTTNATGGDPGALPPGLESTATSDGTNANVVDMRRRRMAEMDGIRAVNEGMNSASDQIRADIDRLRNAIDGTINPTAGPAPAARLLELRGEPPNPFLSGTGTAMPATAAAAFGVGNRGGVGGRTRAAGHNRPIGRCVYPSVDDDNIYFGSAGQMS